MDALRSLGRILAMVVLLVLLTFSISWYSSGGWHCLTPSAKLLGQTRHVRDSVFATLDGEDAFHVFVCGYPAQLGLLDAFARMGASAIPVLRRHLTSERRELTIASILQVLDEMQFTRTYNVRADSALLGSAHRAVARIENPMYYARAAAALRRIESGPPPR